MSVVQEFVWWFSGCAEAVVLAPVAHRPLSTEGTAASSKTSRSLALASAPMETGAPPSRKGSGRDRMNPLPMVPDSGVSSRIATSASRDPAENERWRRYEYAVGRTVLRSLPDVFAIESTNYCNIRCIMCPRGEPDLMDRALGNMDDDVFRKIVDGWDLFTEPCWFHWFGEPLMHPRLFEQIAYAKAAGVANLGISSNATLLTEKNRARILDSELDTLMLCIDGANAETYEHIRRSSVFTYEEVCENVRSFFALRNRVQRSKPHTILQIIVMEDTREQLDEFKSIWTAAGADEILFKEYTVWGNQGENDFASLAPREQLAQLRTVRAHPCWNMWSSVVIAWDGTVVPCCYDYNGMMPMGNVRTQSLAEIWNGDAYRALRTAERAGKNASPLCRNCTEAPGFVADPSTAPPPGYPDA